MLLLCITFEIPKIESPEFDQTSDQRVKIRGGLGPSLVTFDLWDCLFIFTDQVFISKLKLSVK